MILRKINTFWIGAIEHHRLIWTFFNGIFTFVNWDLYSSKKDCKESIGSGLFESSSAISDCDTDNFHFIMFSKLDGVEYGDYILEASMSIDDYLCDEGFWFGSDVSEKHLY